MARVLGLSKLDKQLAGLAREYPKQTTQAINKTATRAATRVRRSLASELKLPQRILHERVKGWKAKRGDPTPRASVWVGNKSKITLTDVPGAKVTTKGVLRVGRNRIQTFAATMPSGYQGRFVRAPGSKHEQRPDGTWTELPIEEPRVRLEEPARQIIVIETERQWREYFPKELRRLADVAKARAGIRNVR